MSAQQVQKLQTLLARVRERRDLARPVHSAPQVAAERAVSESPTTQRRNPAVVAEAPRRTTRDELSFADVSLSSAPPAAAPAFEDARGPSTTPSPPPPASASVDAGPPAKASPRPITLPDAEAPVAPSEPDQRILHSAPGASGPVATAVGEAPMVMTTTFEALITRSLALRPRG